MQALPNSLIVLTAHASLQESADTAFPFRQDSNFWYLTGLQEPNALLVIDTKKAEASLLLPKKNEYQDEWDGSLDIAKIKEQTGISDICERSVLSQKLLDAKKLKLQICYITPAPEIIEPYGFYSNPARRVLEAEIRKIEDKPKDIRLDIARLRQIKQPVELDAIQEAINITGKTLLEIKNRLDDFTNEKDLERAITAGFYANGSDGHAYTPIVAGGVNASVIHYTDNNQNLSDSQLILLDVGAKVDGYAADISRTWAYGKPTDIQKTVYDAAIFLQDKAFSLLKAGVDIRQYQEIMEKFAAKEIKKLGGNPDRYPHGFSHFLGIDVHDAGDYSSPLQVGSIITVEPGLYFKELGIGVRIEDDILITEYGFKNLSEQIPRTL